MMSTTILIGFVFVAIGLITKVLPPKKINALYGYRSTSSMRNIDSWNEANGVASTVAIVLGAMTMVIGLLYAQILPVSPTADLILGITCLCLLVFLLFYLTEQHMNKHFDNAGNRK